MEDKTIREILDKVKSPIMCCDGCIEDKNSGYGDDIIGCCCRHIYPEDALVAIHARLKEILPKKKSCGGFDGAFENGQNNMIDQVLKILEQELTDGK